jgi:hypothetical protein
MVDRVLRWREPAARAAFRVVPLDVLSYVDIDVQAFAVTFDDVPHRETTPNCSTYWPSTRRRRRSS